ncbi:hypothetical protein LTC53_14440 [Xanthomonas translucens pv. undulosa]|nr:hypothetical protein LTC53_14440 [Xanthomonas translucens pv. undulosa]WLA03849.1 hypothetical protein MO329_14480 [Xanthomonas translucens]
MDYRQCYGRGKPCQCGDSAVFSNLVFIQYQAEESDEGWGKRGDSNNSGGGASDVCYMFRDPLAGWRAAA